MKTVADKKKKPDKPSDDANAPKATRNGIPLYIYLQRDLGIALASRLKISRRTKTEEVSIALEEYLSKHGNWPLPKNGA